MLRDLIPLLLALAAAAAIYAIREWHRRRRQPNPKRPGITLAETWELWKAGVRNEADTQFVRANEFPARVAAAAAQSLERTARFFAEAGGHERDHIRRAALESAATSLYLEQLTVYPERDRSALIRGYNEGMEDLLRDSALLAELRWQVLRLHLKLKYDDAVPNDWFHQFLHVARPYIAEKVRLAREFVLEMNEGAGRFVEIYDELLNDLGKSALKQPPKKRFVPPAQ